MSKYKSIHLWPYSIQSNEHRIIIAYCSVNEMNTKHNNKHVLEQFSNNGLERWKGKHHHDGNMNNDEQWHKATPAWFCFTQSALQKCGQFTVE